MEFPMKDPRGLVGFVSISSWPIEMTNANEETVT